ncbi:MAG: Undecaprenyl-phosphate glucose phosphotransferase [Candidatus Giovannonibacteria bacterium GW2011_GWA2_53_7]|uniref:Undecaprenyl-phosphate glucose phosphotransferase n=1 Tax=Candidatus Giovannonibacteria bacterium GW2011_GWA2_53_7 TaxID=1618650 RepID=A0A0G1XYR9_9BACT|nr:MAG: Undecaprenyl-phosphate glucose phosphotransferase [Candidatus Giovannonibacteria bacterium GW2011_GWA2_53_7]
MKRPDLFFTAILVPLDALAIFGAGLAAYHLRLAPIFTNVRPVIFHLSIERFSQITTAAVLVWLLVFALSGLYRVSRRRIGEELKQIFLAGSSAMAVIFAFLFFTLEAFDSRFIVLAGWALAILFLSLERVVVRSIQRSLYLLKIGVRRTVIIGEDEASRILRHTFETRRRLGVEVVATYTTFDAKTEASLKRLAESKKIDDIVFTDTEANREVLTRLKTFSDVEHVNLAYSADLFSVGSLRMEVSTISGVPVMLIKKTPLDGWGAIYKRGFDIIGSILLLLLASPLLLLAMIGILFETGRPILFKNERVGETGRRFDTLKFRSMRAEYSVGRQKGLGDQTKAEELEEELIRKKSIKEGPVYKISDDPRVTIFGRFIRKYSIDELPQLFNVLAGSMSLVGPRPHQPREVKNYLPHHLKVHTVRPGITGLSQISGRSDLEFEDEVRLDTFYIENWSPLLDLIILLKTPWVVVFKKGAY